MKTKLFLLITLSTSLSAFAQFPGGKNYRFSPEELRFNYQAYDGKDNYPCTHQVENEMSQDWLVVCGPKTYGVHLWLTEYRRVQVPQLSMELLYWVTDRSATATKNDSGTTLWFHFKQGSDLYSISAKQGVDNDTAGLYLDIQPK